MWKEYENDQPDPRPTEYGDMIDTLYENYHKIILSFSFESL